MANRDLLRLDMKKCFDSWKESLETQTEAERL